MIDRLIDFIDCRLETSGGEVVVAGKGRFEGFQVVLEVGDIDVLGSYQSQFSRLFQRFHGCIAEQCDEWNEELWANDIGFREAMRYINNA